MDDALTKLSDILGSNKKLNFVDRIINKDKWPVITYRNGDIATHKMAWGEADGKAYAYPTIVYDGRDLVELPEKKAFDYAMETGQFIEFDKPTDAAWFTQNYKKVWGE